MTALIRWMGVAAGTQRKMRSFCCIHPENELVVPKGIGQFCLPNASHIPQGNRNDFWRKEEHFQGSYVYILKCVRNV